VNTNTGFQASGNGFTPSASAAAYDSDRIVFGSSVSNFYVINQASTGVVLPNGNTAWSAQSDQRLKTNIDTLSDTLGLAAIEKLNPVQFNWINPGASTSTQLGFIAQQVQQIFPQLVTVGTTTTFTLADGSTTTVPDTLYLNYEGLISPLVKAVQEIASVSVAFKTRLIAWLGNASNGITDLYATIVHAKEFCAQKSDGTQVCVTGRSLEHRSRLSLY